MKFNHTGSDDQFSPLEIDTAIRTFDKLGESGPHSPEGLLLASILNHCVDNDIPFSLVFMSKRGYYVKRDIVDGVMPDLIRRTLESHKPKED